MNIYLHVEIAARELDSKILLGTLAADRGHDVIISEMSPLKEALFRGILPPGIFHDKSLVPSIHYDLIYKEMIRNDILITSLDEESGVLDHAYNDFAKDRYSNYTTEQASAIFCWGDDDEKILKSFYSKASSKIYKTGSPRVDLWRPQFSKNCKPPVKAPSKPFILIVSNMHTSNYIKPFYEWGGFRPYQLNKATSYYTNDPDNFKKQFNKISEDNLKLSFFVEAIHYLSKNNDRYDIILRPHPLEDINAWKVYLRGLVNVHVVNEGSISPWINHAFAIMHNSCTSAIEATISGKEVITYIPFKQTHSWGEVANKLGHRAQTLVELNYIANSILDNMQNKNLKKDSSFPEILLKKIYIDKNELAAEKIINVWEKLSNEKLLKTYNLNKFKRLLNVMKIKKYILKLKNLFLKNNTNKNNDYKFPSLKINEVSEKVKNFQKKLNLNKNLDCKLLLDKTILISKND